MSVGPAALGNVLVQRLDAVLGTTMSAASANQVSGARPDAVSQPGSLEKPGQADGSPRDPRQGVQSGARAVNAPPSSTPRPPPRWPGRARPGPATTPRLPRPPRWAAPPARFSRCWRSTPTQPRPCKARATGPRCIGRPPAGATAGQPPRASRRPAASPGAARQYARRTTAGRCRAPPTWRRSNASPATPATAPARRPARPAPPRARPHPPGPAAARRVGRAGSGRPRAGPGPARSPADQRPVLRITPGRSGLRPRQPIRAAQRTAGRPQAGRRPAAATQRRRHARTRRSASRGAGGGRAPPAAPMRPRPARRSTASTRT